MLNIPLTWAEQEFQVFSPHLNFLNTGSVSGAPWSWTSWSHLGLRAPKSHSLLVKPSIKLMWDASSQVFSPLSCLLLMPFLIQCFMDYFSLLTLFPVSSKQPSFPSLHSSYHDFWPCNSRLFSLHKTLDIFSQWKQGQWKHQHIDVASKESCAQCNVWVLFGTPIFTPGNSGF